MEIAAETADAAERARRRLFARGATARDREQWEALRAAAAAATPVVDAAPAPRVEAAPDPAAPVALVVPIVPAARRFRRALVVLAVVAALGGLAIGASAARPAPAAPAARPTAAPGPLATPSVAGTVLVATGNTLDPVVSADPDAPEPGTVVWNPGYARLTATGRTIAVALRCRGAGRVEVVLTSGERFPFTCGRAARSTVRTAPAPSRPFTVLVPTTGPVLWTLVIASR